MENSTLFPRAAPAALFFTLLTACAPDAAVGPALDRSATTPPAVFAAGTAYTPVYVFPPGDYVSIAFALNDRGQVVGRGWFSQAPGVQIGRAFLWTPDGPNAETGQMGVLRMPIGIPQTSSALDINDAGVVVGWVNNFGASSAVVWTTDVGTPLGGSQAVAINNRGYVVVQNGENAELWTPPGTYASGWQGHPLGSFSARAMNNRGEIVGWKLGMGAVVWRPNEPGGVTGEFVALGSLAGGSAGALDINDKGQIVGSEVSAGIGEFALLWEPTRPNATTFAVTNLNPVIGASQHAVATGINNKGEITGSGALASYGGRTQWVWHPTGKPGAGGTLTILGSDLPPDVQTEKRGPAINDRGDVAYELNGRAVLWRK